MAEFSYDVAVGQFLPQRIFTLIRPSMSLEDPTPWVLEMQNAFPEVQKELDGVKVLFSHALTVGMLIGSKSPSPTSPISRARKINVLGTIRSPTSCARGLRASVEHPYGRCS